MIITIVSRFDDDAIQDCGAERREHWSLPSLGLNPNQVLLTSEELGADHMYDLPLE